MLQIVNVTSTQHQLNIYSQEWEHRSTRFCTPAPPPVESHKPTNACKTTQQTRPACHRLLGRATHLLRVELPNNAMGAVRGPAPVTLVPHTSMATQPGHGQFLGYKALEKLGARFLAPLVMRRLLHNGKRMQSIPGERPIVRASLVQHTHHAKLA